MVNQWLYLDTVYTMNKTHQYHFPRGVFTTGSNVRFSIQPSKGQNTQSNIHKRGYIDTK